MRIALPFTLRNRSGNTAKDARAKNCVVEQKGGRLRLLKRPALDQAFESITGRGQLIFPINRPDGDDIGTIQDDVLTVGLVASVRSLSFFVQPDESDINVAITPAVVVHALNSLGQIATGYAGDVTIALVSNPTGASLSGTLTVTAVSGVATFSNLKVSRSGEGFTLQATDSTGLRRDVSDAFDIPTRCVFTDQPQTTAPNTVMTAVEVTIQDPGGNTDTGYNGNVTLTLFGTVAGTLSGTTTKAAAAGVATFSDLSIDLEGTYDLLAEASVISTAYPPASQFSASFQIASFTHTMTAANTSGGGTDNTGFINGTLGSITPTTFNSVTIEQLTTDFPIASPNDKTTVFTLNGSQLQSFFTSITANGKTLNSVDASYADLGVITIWSWTGTSGSNADMFPATGTIPVTIT